MRIAPDSCEVATLRVLISITPPDNRPMEFAFGAAAARPQLTLHSSVIIMTARSAGWHGLTPFFHGRAGDGYTFVVDLVPLAAARSSGQNVNKGKGSRMSAAWGDWVPNFYARVAAAEAAAAAGGGSSAASGTVVPHCAKCGTTERGSQWKHSRADGARLCLRCYTGIYNKQFTEEQRNERLQLGYQAPCGGCAGCKREPAQQQ
ncbi:hypothetical protein HYH02_015237 [Chlamydomonas schloesseri]|uniref:Uncharacterized protein n=1 Tax=Chlamydomonas schloesseri TaxID=2026947 RepID=A0A835SQB5_9CHLO|nr:hypothetical protein HYH02_015237 [Chlamydomonas schloesseri]|eukprot:KAG2424056.1 hypothetical protein HYH02_015237 [Chlamydomonas schloesseri]